MKKERSKLEMFMRKLGDMLGFKYRFHKHMGDQPRKWTLWKD